MIRYYAKHFVGIRWRLGAHDHLSKGFGMTAKNPLKLFQTVFGMDTSEFLQFSSCALSPFCTEDLPGKDSRFALVG